MRTNCLVCGVFFDAPEGDEYPVCPDCTVSDDFDEDFDDDEQEAEEIVEEMQEIVRHIELPLDRIEDLVRNGVLRPVGNNDYLVINPEAVRQYNARINPPPRGPFPGVGALLENVRVPNEQVAPLPLREEQLEEVWRDILRGERNIG